MADTRTIWKQRVSSWRASGESAEGFAVGRGFAASTLKWWASKLRGDSTPIIRMAQLVRSSRDEARGRGAVIVEGLDARVRITIEAGADRETVATVLAFACSPQDRA
jgi:hypothetical protein